MNIDMLVKDYKTMEELKVFCASQLKQIISLNNKIRDLEEKLKNNNAISKEINNLPEKSSSNLPANSNATFLVEDDAKTISQVQLKLIKEQAFERELTLEEAKRVEIFNKILNNENKSDKDKPIKANAKILNDTELLKLVTNE